MGGRRWKIKKLEERIRFEGKKKRGYSRPHRAPFAVNVAIREMETTPGNAITNSCGNIPVEDQNVLSFLKKKKERAQLSRKSFNFDMKIRTEDAPYPSIIAEGGCFGSLLVAYVTFFGEGVLD